MSALRNTLHLPKVVRRIHCAICTYPALYGLVVTHERLALIFRRPLRQVTHQTSGRARDCAFNLNTVTDTYRRTK